MLVPLHVRSHYSIGFGTSPVDELVERAAILGLHTLALTDIENLHGQPRFHDLCQRHRIRPITGVELRGGEAVTGRIVLLARDANGYRNLCRIVSRRRGGAGSDTEQYLARDPVAAVAAHPQGLFVLTDDAPLLERLVRAELDRSTLRLLLVRPSREGAEDAPIAAAKKHGIAVAADPQVTMLDPREEALRVLLAALRRKTTLAESDLEAAIAEQPRAGKWLRSHADAAALFADVPAAIDAANDVAAGCAFDLRRTAAMLPGADAFGGPPSEVLGQRCIEGLQRARSRGRCIGRRYDERLQHELEVIAALGYDGYFLAAGEIVRGAQADSIAIAPRGSAAGSLAVHLLGISPIDPVAHGLQFERFLHAQRSKPPDIDIDVCFKRRDELLGWIYRRFGRNRVSMVGAVHTYGVRSALRESLKAFGAKSSQIDNAVAALARRDPSEELDLAEDAGVTLTPLRLPFRPTTVATLTALIGTPRYLALHPAGIVIAPGDVDASMPVEHAPRNLTVAQYDADSIESTGLTKLDLLGNRFLTQRGATLELARHGSGNNADSPISAASFSEDLPLDDEVTLERIGHADTIGCYQIETPPLRALLLQLPIRKFEDCVTALALIRPGAAAGSAKREYVDRARRQQDTHGAFDAQSAPLYDEELMSELRAAGAISLAAADQLRSAIIDAGPNDLRELERQFLQSAARAELDMPRAIAAWRNAVRFAAYAFCKAHALSYALMAYEAAYLKSHYPTEFACALLDNYGGAYPLRTIAADLIRSGVRILPPSVNRSGLESRIEDVAVRTGLGHVKQLSDRNAGALIADRRARGPFASTETLLARVPLSRRELRALMLCGACDELVPPGIDASPAQPAHPADGGAGKEDAYNRLVRIRDELQILDMHLTDHPMRVLRGEATRCGCRSSGWIRAHAIGGSRVRFAGLIAASRRHRSARGSFVHFLTFEDEDGLLEALIEHPHYQRLTRQLTTPGPYLVDGPVANDRGYVRLVVEGLGPFHERADAWSSSSAREGSLEPTR